MLLNSTNDATLLIRSSIFISSLMLELSLGKLQWSTPKKCVCNTFLESGRVLTFLVVRRVLAFLYVTNGHIFHVPADPLFWPPPLRASTTYRICAFHLLEVMEVRSSGPMEFEPRYHMEESSRGRLLG